MDTKIRYNIELTAREGVEGRIQDALNKMAADAQLSANAKQRTGNVKMEKWWSVVAGLLLVITFILYSFYLTIPAVILLGVLVAFLIYVGISLRLQRNKKESAEHEISPRRSADAMIRTAVRMPVSGRDVTGYMNGADMNAFGAELSSVIESIANAEEMAKLSITTTVKVIEAEELGEHYSVMPVEYVLGLGDDKELVINYKAPFAIAATGDCILADTNPAIGEITRSDVSKKQKH